MTWNKDVIASRKVRLGRDQRVDAIELVRSVIRENWFRRLVHLIEDAVPAHRTGRPRRHSSATIALMVVLNQIFRSQVETETYIRSLNHWEALRRALTTAFPDDPLLKAGAPAPTRSVIRHAKAHFDEDLGSKIQRLLEADALLRAAFMGLGNNTGSKLEPSRNAILFGDGVVIRPPSDHLPGSVGVHPLTGEIRPRRYDPDATFHTNGLGARVYGNVFCHLSAFTGHSGEQITFSVRPILKGSGPTEAEHAAEMARTVKESATGFSALTWDKALRSHTIDQLWNLGLQPLVGVYDKTGRTTEVVRLDTHTVNGLRVKTVAHRGAVCIQGIGPQLIVLEPDRLTYHPNRTGTVRVYGTFRIPEGSPCDTRLWGRAITQRLNSRNKSDLVYGEHVRAIPPGTERWKNLYGNRSLAESLNARYKARLLPGQRARSYGQTKQWIDLCLTMLIWNTQATIVFSRRTGRSPSALAAAA